MKKFPTWCFTHDNDHSVELALKDEKTASTFIYNNYTAPPNELLQVGQIGILIFGNDKQACKTRTTNVIITEFKNRTMEFARLECENNQTFESYQQSTFDFFRKIDPNFEYDSKIVFFTFEIIEDLTKTRLKTASIIAEANKSILSKISPITEINAGFNNDIFNVSDRYIIKVCANTDLESEFLKESSFYERHSNSKHIPKLFRFDKTKSVVPFFYEIIEKINGDSVYYHWYKMNEEDREETIRKIVEIMKEVHQKVDSSLNWCEFIKNDIKNCYEKIKENFNEDEKAIFMSSFSLFDRYLTDNRFCWIHNDLHFDNILADGENLYLIDFNDVMIAPIDYDFRIFYLCKDMPWRWANTEMDPLQKKDDYKNIDKYILKYYKEIAEIENLEQRMIIYSIQNEINLIVKHNNLSLKESLFYYVKRLLEIK